MPLGDFMMVILEIIERLFETWYYYSFGTAL